MTSPDPDRLKALEDRINSVKATQAPKPTKEEHYSMANQAWRMVIELVAGIGIGFAFGYGLDTLFGTMPIFLVVFVGLGFVAGVRSMMRTAAGVQEKMMAEQSAKDEKG